MLLVGALNPLGYQEIQTLGGGQAEKEISKIDSLALPSVLMSEMNCLLACSGIYFAIEESGQVGYLLLGVLRQYM